MGTGGGPGRLQDGRPDQERGAALWCELTGSTDAPNPRLTQEGPYMGFQGTRGQEESPPRSRARGMFTGRPQEGRKVQDTV